MIDLDELIYRALPVMTAVLLVGVILLVAVFVADLLL